MYVQVDESRFFFPHNYFIVIKFLTVKEGSHCYSSLSTRLPTQRGRGSLVQSAYRIVSCPDPPTRGEDLVTQAGILGLAEVLKPCNCKCKNALKSGLISSWNGIQGWTPVSHLIRLKILRWLRESYFQEHGPKTTTRTLSLVFCIHKLKLILVE